MGKKQLTELEQAIADLKAAQKVRATKQAALARAFDADQKAGTAEAEARATVQKIMAAEARAAEAATKAAVGQQQTTTTRRATRPGAQQQLAGAESNGPQALA